MKAQSWQDMEWEIVTQGLARKIITGTNVMSAQVRLDIETVVPEHAHHNEQISYVMQGALRFTIAGEELTVNAGQVLVVPPHVPHGVVALEPSLVLDTFSPIRQDWLDHTDAYLRQPDQKK
jgi:quercetin dioxygenase-like cupin family protein